jgi:hypothetical protein
MRGTGAQGCRASPRLHMAETAVSTMNVLVLDRHLSPAVITHKMLPEMPARTSSSPAV